MILVAIALYLLTTALAVRALLAARNSGRGLSEARGWAIVAGGFVLIAIVRALDLENVLRAQMRTSIRASGDYAARGEMQGALVSIGLILFSGAVALLWWRWSRSPAGRGERLTRIGLLATGGYVPLYALRLISLHSIDRLLYFGPVHPNWLIEGALIVTAAASALLYLRLRSGAPPPG